MPWPRRIIRMTAKPLLVARAVLMLGTPRVGRITRWSVP
jgi:hypothetical protein